MKWKENFIATKVGVGVTVKKIEKNSIVLTFDKPVLQLELNPREAHFIAFHLEKKGEIEKLKMKSLKHKEGWGYSTHLSKKWHYFINGMSLCGKIGFYRGDLEQSNDDSDDNCVACKKALAKRKIKNLVKRGKAE